MMMTKFFSGSVSYLMFSGRLTFIRPYVVRENLPKAASKLSARPKPLITIAPAQVHTD